MLDIEKLWRDAPAESIVCTITKSTKNMVLNAIMSGVSDVDSLKKTIPLCGDNECAKHNSSGRGCKDNVETLFSIYVPTYRLMMEGGGCSKAAMPRVLPAAPKECGSPAVDSCGNCSLCGDKKYS